MKTPVISVTLRIVLSVILISWIVQGSAIALGIFAVLVTIGAEAQVWLIRRQREDIKTLHRIVFILDSLSRERNPLSAREVALRAEAEEILRNAAIGKI
jgi:hypothetical protein